MARCFCSRLNRPSVPCTSGMRPSKPRQTVVNTESRATRLNCWKMTPVRAQKLLGRANDTAVLLHRLTKQIDRAGIRLAVLRCDLSTRHQAGDRPDQGGLAGAGRADQRDHLAALQLEQSILEHRCAAVQRRFAETRRTSTRASANMPSLLAESGLTAACDNGMNRSGGFGRPLSRVEIPSQPSSPLTRNRRLRRLLTHQSDVVDQDHATAALAGKFVLQISVD